MTKMLLSFRLRVVVHAGSSMSSGHYFAYVRTSSGTWARMDDACVSKVRSLDQLHFVIGRRRGEAKGVVKLVSPIRSKC